MTSWHDLPFEIKSRITFHNIEIIVISTLAVRYEYRRRHKHSMQARKDLLCFPYSVPKMWHEVFEVVLSKRQRCSAMLYGLVKQRKEYDARVNRDNLNMPQQDKYRKSREVQEEIDLC